MLGDRGQDGEGEKGPNCTAQMTARQSFRLCPGTVLLTEHWHNSRSCWEELSVPSSTQTRVRTRAIQAASLHSHFCPFRDVNHLVQSLCGHPQAWLWTPAGASPSHPAHCASVTSHCPAMAGQGFPPKKRHTAQGRPGWFSAAEDLAWGNSLELLLSEQIHW